MVNLGKMKIFKFINDNIVNRFNIRKHWKYIIAFMFLTCIAIFVYNDSFLYNTSIAKVEKVSSKEKNIVYGNSGEEEKYYVQTLYCVVLNGQYKGRNMTFENTYSYSGVRDEKYSTADRLFVSIKEEKGKLQGKILNLKKDFYVVVLIEILIFVLIVVAGKTGIMTVISMIINIVLLYAGLKFYFSGHDIITLIQILLILWSMITLVIIGGIKKSTLVTVLSTMIVLIIIYIMYFIIIKTGNEPEYIMLEYIATANDIDKIFMAEVLTGGLGAIIDVAVSMASAVEELVIKDDKISEKSLFISVREIGHDIMGTMINVLFFSFVSGSIPMIILQIKNSYKITTIVKLYMPFELIRFLVGAIGIVAAIPVAGFVSVKLLKKKNIQNKVK